jgi:hypothetical protein
LWSQVQNSAYPEIEIHAVKEQNATLQLATFWHDDWFFGIGLRAFERHFVWTRFSLFDYLSEEGSTILEPRSQNGVYIVPGMAYAPLIDYSPKFSLVVENMGVFNKTYNSFNDTPVVEVGASVTPVETRAGDFELGVHYQLDTETDRQITNDVLLAGVWQMTYLNFAASAGPREWALGGEITLRNLRAGATYRDEELPQFSRQERNKVVYTHLGIDF